jgi:hypothetical protein
MKTPVRPSMDATEIDLPGDVRVSGNAMIATSPTFRQM